MDKFFITLKKIRKGKNYTQAYVADSNLSRSLYVKIENGTVIPSFEKIFFVLEKLDMKFDEFIFIKNGFKNSSKYELFYLLNKIQTNSDILSLKKIKKLCKIHLKNSFDIVVQEILYISDALLILNLENDINKAKLLVTPIWERLSKQDSLYTTEIILLSNIFFIFEIETSILIAKRTINEIQKYKEFIGIEKLETSLMLNLTTLLIENGNLLDAEKYNKFSIALCKRNRLYNLLPIAYVHKSILLYHLREFIKSKEIIEKAMLILISLNEVDLLEKLIEEVYKHSRKFYEPIKKNFMDKFNNSFL